MPIGKTRTQADKDWDALDAPRVYTNAELNDFNHKIQRFKESKTLENGDIVKVLNWDKMAVAFGAFNVVKSGEREYYMAAGGPDGKTSRYVTLCSLWGQLQSYLMRKDLAKEHELRDMEKVAENFSIAELSTD